MSVSDLRVRSNSPPHPSPVHLPHHQHHYHISQSCSRSALQKTWCLISLSLLLCSSCLSSVAPPHLHLSSALYLSLNLPTPSIRLSCCVTHRWTAQPLCISSVAISARLHPLFRLLQSETPCDTLHERARSLLLPLFSSQATYARNQSQRGGGMEETWTVHTGNRK